MKKQESTLLTHQIKNTPKGHFNPLYLYINSIVTQICKRNTNTAIATALATY